MWTHRKARSRSAWRIRSKRRGNEAMKLTKIVGYFCLMVGFVGLLGPLYQRTGVMRAMQLEHFQKCCSRAGHSIFPNALSPNHAVGICSAWNIPFGTWLIWSSFGLICNHHTVGKPCCNAVGFSPVNNCHGPRCVRGFRRFNPSTGMVAVKKSKWERNLMMPDED